MRIMVCARSILSSIAEYYFLIQAEFRRGKLAVYHFVIDVIHPIS